MRRFCIVTNRIKDTDYTQTKRVVRYLEQKGCKCFEISENSQTSIEHHDFSNVPEDTECCIVLGGDGTIIEAAEALAESGLPIIGINLGTLGFLSIIETDGIEEALDMLVADDFVIENRMMTEAEVCHNGNIETFLSLNDIVITRNGILRVISTEAYVNGSLVSSFDGDGVIVATPTGSTGYNLSAGGPVVTPEAKLMVLTPICPHSLYSRGIVVSAADEIKVRLVSRRKSQPDEAVLTIDGRISYNLSSEDLITVRASEKKTKLIRFKNQSFFDLLHKKLGN